MIRKPIWPYLVVGLFSFVIFQSFYHYYQLSTAAVPFMGMLRLRWLLEHWERSLLVFSLIQEPCMQG